MLGSGTGEADWWRCRNILDGLTKVYVVFSLPFFGLRVQFDIACCVWLTCSVIACVQDICVIWVDTVRSSFHRGNVFEICGQRY